MSEQIDRLIDEMAEEEVKAKWQPIDEFMEESGLNKRAKYN